MVTIESKSHERVVGERSWALAECNAFSYERDGWEQETTDSLPSFDSPSRLVAINGLCIGFSSTFLGFSAY